MPQCNQKNKKAASGMGNIRKVSKVKNGKEYTYYEARYTEGYDPGSGKQIQRSISGKTQKEVAQKLKAVLSSIDRGDYIAHHSKLLQWPSIPPKRRRRPFHPRQ